MADFGTDIQCLTDLEPSFRLVGSNDCLVQDLYSRLTTPEGSLFYDETYGFDCGALLNADVDNSRIYLWRTKIVNQLEDDERVLSATASIDFDRAQSQITVTCFATTKDGTIRFVIGVKDLNTSLLEVNLWLYLSNLYSSHSPKTK